jgi:hypothetical protein
VILRHTELTAYRCFLPDLAGFTGFCCTGPSPFSQVQSAEYCFCGGEGGHSKSRSLKQRSLLQRGPAPSYTPHAGDISPTVPLVRIPPSLVFCFSSASPTDLSTHIALHCFLWRRGWDSNPRSHCWDACFPSMSIRPLSHLSTPILQGGILTRGLMTSKMTVRALRRDIDVPLVPF